MTPIGDQHLLLPGEEDTIVAIATAPGRGALAVLRLSGPAVVPIGRQVVNPMPDRERVARFCLLSDPSTGDEIDRVVATLYRAPRSYTGEDLLEVSVHGGALVPLLARQAFVHAGARLALPGEFTRRAVLRGKMDILQAEAIGDLIDATSRSMHATALRQLNGALSREIASLRSAILDLEALLAYDIDFPEEDEGPVARDRVLGAAADVLRLLDGLLATAPIGELVRAGALTVIAGAPNAGKSSLFNALVGRARAIVTEIPGTTRDAIEALVEAGRWPLRLVDTAGLRETADVVERLGIEVSERYVGEADLVLAVGDSEESLDMTVNRVRQLTDAPVLPVRTKGDLVAGSDQSSLVADGAYIATSVLEGWGLDPLVQAIEGVLDERYHPGEPESPVLTRERHRQQIGQARDELSAFVEEWDDGGLPAPVVAVHLRSAVHALEELVGVVDVEEVLERVFRSFCVGK